MAFYIVPALVSAGIFWGVYHIYKNMPKAGSPLFKLGYALYTGTRLGYVYYKRDVKKAIRKFNNEGHSFTEAVVFNGLKILPMSLALDNYSYLITDERSQVSVLVDPADHEAVQHVLEHEGVTPTAILTTHKHWDHSGGNKELKKRYPGLRVYGGASDGVPDCTHGVGDCEQIEFGALRFTAYTTPGHTVGHVVYVLDGSVFSAPPCLFSGDHLFIGGIGRMFEGSAGMMLASLDKICDMPDDTLVWPGHEYARDNLEFARSIDPDNEKLQEKYEWVQGMRKARQCTCPAILGEEKTYNPFLRVRDRSIIAALGTDKMALTPEALHTETLLQCRKRKDKFKYKL